MPEPGLVSVVTPCYNAAPFVAETIASVAAQTYPAVEHVVVDDASTDGSDRVIAAQAHRLTTVRLERNGGGSHARNRGAALARGEYLLFLDADDVLTPGALGALVAATQDRLGAVAIGAWQRLRQAEDGAWTVQAAEVPFPPPSDALSGWLSGVWVPPCAVLWPRAVYDSLGGWDEALSYNDDGDLMMRALARGATLVPAHASHPGGALALYRAHDDARISVSRNLFSERPLLSQLRVLDKLVAELESRGRLPRYAAAIGVAYHKLALLAFQQGHPELGRECTRRGERHAGRRAVSRTAAGRLLAGLLGVERKERLVATIARHGVMTSERRHYARLRGLAESSGMKPAAPVAPTPTPARVAVCVATYRRPEGLRRLLEGIDRLRIAQSESADPAAAVRVVIVDNDPARSASAVAAASGEWLRWPVVYLAEAERGIAQARNRALVCAMEASVDFIAFIDDDEVPELGWLDALLRVQGACGADAVCGPVLPEFEAPAAAYLRDFFHRPRHRTGERVRYGSTNNVLIRAGWLAEHPLRFDERLGLTGGEDTHFFLRLTRSGGTLVWADEAVVREVVPRSRVSVGWVLRRAYRAGITMGFCERDVERSAGAALRRLLKSAVWIGQGMLLPFAALLGPRYALRNLRQVCWGAGGIAGLVGVRYEVYRRVDGR